jgi:N4-gp56 family major capsid protein
MAITKSSDLPQEFVDQLSAELLLEPDTQYVFATLAGAARAGAMDIPGMIAGQGQKNLAAAMNNGTGTPRWLDPRWMAVAGSFAKVVAEPTQPGKVILIDQPRYLNGLFSIASRQLTEGTRISANPQAISMGQVSLTIREYAGPHDGSAVAPVGITDFATRRAVHNMVQYVGLLLRRDRNKWMDSVIIDTLLLSTNLTTPGGTAEASLTAGSKLTDAVLASALRSLQERGVPPFANGMYMLVLSPKHLEDLRDDARFRESARYLGPEGPMVTGHIANWGGFMLMTSTNIPLDAVGSGGAVAGYQALAFGPEAFGWAIGMDVEARRSKDDD